MREGKILTCVVPWGWDMSAHPADSGSPEVNTHNLALKRGTYRSWTFSRKAAWKEIHKHESAHGRWWHKARPEFSEIRQRIGWLLYSWLFCRLRLSSLSRIWPGSSCEPFQVHHSKCTSRQLTLLLKYLSHAHVGRYMNLGSVRSRPYLDPRLLGLCSRLGSLNFSCSNYVHLVGENMY